MEAGRYCSAVFIDVSQASDKLWHDGLLHKIKRNLSPDLYAVIKSYLLHKTFLVKHGEAVTRIKEIHSGVPQGSVLGPVLYLLYTADLPTSLRVTTATYADDTAILATHKNPILASQRLQESLTLIQRWLKKWRIKANETKSTHVTFTTRKETCPPVTLNDRKIPQADEVKYLGLYLDRKLNWRKHIFTKRKQLGLQLSKMYWLLGRKSQLTVDNKLLLYKAILKPIWTYGIQLWDTAFNSNI